MTNKEYEYIIEQQKEIIKQQKDLIDSLMSKLNNTSVILKEHPFDYKPSVVYYPSVNPNTSPFTCESTGESCSETTATRGYMCKAPKDAICDGKCKDCCYYVMLC